MKKLIALHAVQFAIAGKLTEIPAGSPFSIDDEQAVAHLFNAGAVREPTDDELAKLFKDTPSEIKPPAADGKPVGNADLSKSTKAELVKLGAEKGLTLDEASSKADLIAAIEAHESDEL